MSNIKASIVTIGDELLIGQVIDTNSAWMAQRLNEIGIPVVRRVAVGDDPAQIKKALDEESGNASIVFLTGGLGPTADDITKPLLCGYFGAKLVVNEEVLAHVKNLFAIRNRPLQDVNLRQAEVPDNCVVLFNKMGTAPGMWFAKGEKIFISLPGVPFEMMGIMEQEVLPRLAKLSIGHFIIHKSIITAGEGESFVAEKIKDIEEDLPADIKLAYLPSPGMVRLRLTSTGTDRQALDVRMHEYQRQIAERLSDIVLSLEDVPMPQILGKALLEKNATLGFAESCTGGYLGHLITQVPGSGRYFKGSIVTYNNEVKKRLLKVNAEVLSAQTAISEEVAIQMATSALALLGCGYSLSVTGILGPGGEENENNPVGTVWVAVANEKETRTKRFNFHYGRAMNKEMAAQMAMLMLWKFLNNKL